MIRTKEKLHQIGFVDITDISPISFIETLQTLDEPYHLNCRLKRTKNEINTVVNIGSAHIYHLYVTGKSFFNGCSSQFRLETHIKDTDLVLKYIDANEFRVLELYKQYKNLKMEEMK